MDIACAVCGEPWDSYGAQHGDMEWWQYDLFKAGAGCPGCEGAEPEGGSEAALEEHLKNIIIDGNTDDPHAFEQVNNLGLEEKRPEWKEPPPKVVWTCKGCDVSVVISNEAPYDGKEISKNPDWLEWHGGQKVHYSHGSGPYQYPDVADSRGRKYSEKPEREPELFINKEPYCPGCAQECSNCSNGIFARSGLDEDVDAPGANFQDPHDPFRSLCRACYEAVLNEDESEDEQEGDEDF